jgi:uncharacterized membrane protein
MSSLLVIGHPDVATVERARDRLLELHRSELVTLRDLTVAENVEGRIRLRHDLGGTGDGTAGALWGGLIGLLFFTPLLGMAIGAGAGAIGGSATGSGIDDELMLELGQQLTLGAAALFALVEQAASNEVVEDLEPPGGKIVQASLSNEEETALREAIDQARFARA